MADTPNTIPDAASAEKPANAERTVEWIDRDMATHFANVVNVQSTREQVDLFFGTNQTWNFSDTPRVAVDLSSRVILTPHAAKRLWLILGGVLREYEQRYGTLAVDR